MEIRTGRVYAHDTMKDIEGQPAYVLATKIRYGEVYFRALDGELKPKGFEFHRNVDDANQKWAEQPGLTSAHVAIINHDA